MVKNFGADKILILLVLIIIVFGLLMAYSSTMILAKAKHGDSLFFIKKQVQWIGLGLLIFAVIVMLKFPVYMNKYVIYGGMILAVTGLMLVFVTGEINNSCRWIRFGPVSVQPSEFAKIAVVLYIAFVLSNKKFDPNNFKQLGFFMLPVVFAELLILKEPDYGNFFLILAVTAIMLFIGGLKFRYFAFSSLFFIPFVYIIIKMNPMRLNRVLAFLEPEKYYTTYGFQAAQSIYAIGSGGIVGQGLGKSTQKLFFLPYAYTDFIFSIIGEEMGLLGTLLVVGFFFFFLMRGLRIAKHTGNRHAYLLVTGLTFLIVTQALINISVAIGILPTKGMPLPFISLGGSSMLASLIIAGIIINISRHRKMVLLND